MEALVRITTRDTGDAAKDYHRFTRGDVVCVQEDGWGWGTRELGADAHDFWRVVKVPSVTLAEAQAWVAGDTTNLAINPWRRKRLNYLDLDALPNKILSDFLGDDARVNGTLVTGSDVAKWKNILTAKGPGSDPTVIG